MAHPRDWWGASLIQGDVFNAHPIPTHFADPTGDLAYLFPYTSLTPAQVVAWS